MSALQERRDHPPASLTKEWECAARLRPVIRPSSLCRPRSPRSSTSSGAAFAPAALRRPAEIWHAGGLADAISFQRRRFNQMTTDPTVDTPYVSTGDLPPAEQVRLLVNEAHERFRTNAEGD